MKIILKITLVATMTGIAATTLAADKSVEEAIKARQGFMEVIGFNMGILGDMAKGKRDYDAALASAAAKNIYTASTMDGGAMWPKGSDNGNPALADKTKALPYLWQNFAEIGNKHKDWVSASEKLAASAGKSLKDLRKTIGPVGQSCKDCHKLTVDE